MLSSIYISFLVHRKMAFWPGSPESKQGVPLWVSAPFHARCPCRAHCLAHATSALASSWNPHGGLHTMHTWLIIWWRWDKRMDMRDGGDLFFETIWFDSAWILYSVFVNRRFEIHPVLIHAALTSRIISVPDCKLQSGEYSHEIKYNNGISGLVHESGLPAYCVTRLRSLLFSIVPFTAFSMDSRKG